MRHLPANFEKGDRLELQLTVEAELLASDTAEEGRAMSLRVVALKNRSNGKAVLWSQDGDGGLALEVEVGANQRLLALGLSARQRGRLKERLAGLSPEEASQLLAELAGKDRKS